MVHHGLSLSVDAVLSFLEVSELTFSIRGVTIMTEQGSDW